MESTSDSDGSFQQAPSQEDHSATAQTGTGSQQVAHTLQSPEHQAWTNGSFASPVGPITYK